MASISLSSLDFADTAISNIYYKQQAPIYHVMPRTIASQKDVLNLHTSIRNKRKEASQLYEGIKKKFLFNLDSMAESALQDIDKLNGRIIKIYSDDQTKKELKKKLTAIRNVNKDVSSFAIAYDKLTWFTDPTLISTIRFHEKLNNVFLGKAEESLEYEIDQAKIQEIVKNVKLSKEYIKSIMVITFFPILAYGAIYASINYEFSYIIHYQKAVSEAAEEIFHLNPSMKHQFFSRVE